MKCLEWNCDFFVINMLGIMQNSHYCIINNKKIHSLTKIDTDFSNSADTSTVSKMMGGKKHLGSILYSAQLTFSS